MRNFEKIKCRATTCSPPTQINFLPVFWCFRDYMENRIYDEQRMGTEQNEYLLIVPDKLYLENSPSIKVLVNEILVAYISM